MEVNFIVSFIRGSTVYTHTAANFMCSDIQDILTREGGEERVGDFSCGVVAFRTNPVETMSIAMVILMCQ